MPIRAEQLREPAVAAPPPCAPTQAAAARSAGAVILARHGEPALSRRVRLDAEGYRRWWAVYEEGGLLPDQQPPAGLLQAAEEAGAVIASIRPRSIETARAVTNGRGFEADPIWIEAPLPPPNFPAFLRFTPRSWGVISRFWWWFFDHHHQQETRKEAQERAREAAERIAAKAEEGRDVLVLAHGFFNGMVAVELKKLGWRCVDDQGFRYWSARRFEKD